MPIKSTTRIDFGNELNGVLSGLQPTGTIEQDAYGLVQAQLTYIMDSQDAQLNTVLTYYKAKRLYPLTITPQLYSYRTHISFMKGGLMSVVVDFMGIATAGGVSTWPNIQGVVATSAQPIESHPNFSKITDLTIGPPGGTALAGVPPPGTAFNNAIFNQSGTEGAVKWVFGGFGVLDDEVGVPNKKAGIRQYLKPYTTVRGVIYYGESFSTAVSDITKNVGRTLDLTALGILIPSSVFAGSMTPSHYLLSHAGVESIGNANTGSGANTVAYKITYDIMFSGDQGWDADIYGVWL